MEQERSLLLNKRHFVYKERKETCLLKGNELVYQIKMNLFIKVVRNYLLKKNMSEIRKKIKEPFSQSIFQINYLYFLFTLAK